MSEIDYGGQVYPQSLNAAGPFGGINRRDLGAIEMAAAMAAAVRSCGESPDAQEIAKFSYKLSDALIAEGKK